jgi:hypothetical protein
MNTEDGNIIMRITFSSAMESIIIDRVYQKIPEFFAALGGMQTNLLIILSLFVGFFNSFRAEEFVMNNCLKFREHLKLTHPIHYNIIKSNLRSKTDSPLFNSISNVRQETEDPKKKYTDLADDLDKTNDIKNSEIELASNQSRSPLDVHVEKRRRALTPHHRNLTLRPEVEISKQVEKVLSSSKNPICFNNFEIIFRNCKCRNKSLGIKNQLYERATQKLNYYFDVFTYIKKMQEIDIIKYLLLDQDQVKLFNYISKPSVSLSYSDSDDIYQNVQKNREVKIRMRIGELEEIIESYKLLKNRDDSINNRLFYLFDYEIDHLIVG